MSKTPAGHSAALGGPLIGDKPRAGSLSFQVNTCLPFSLPRHPRLSHLAFPLRRVRELDLYYPVLGGKPTFQSPSLLHISAPCPRRVQRQVAQAESLATWSKATPATKRPKTSPFAHKAPADPFDSSRPFSLLLIAAASTNDRIQSWTTSSQRNRSRRLALPRKRAMKRWATTRYGDSGVSKKDNLTRAGNFRRRSLR